MSNTLDSQYWDNRYKDQTTGWDIGSISTPLKEYVDQLADKSISILIPGCGNAYEAAYLLEHGFTNLTLIDISPVLVRSIEEKFADNLGKELRVVCGDFFELDKQFGLVLEQTFFCALDPALRKKYVSKMHEIIKPGGKLVGVLFNRSFEGGPPFGGEANEYRELFEPYFKIKVMAPCYNSISPRKGTEVFVVMVK